MSEPRQIDLTECDREPIRIPGAIQPHGVLITVDLATLEVVQTAGNSKELMGLGIEALTGQALQIALGPGAVIGFDRVTANLALPRPLIVSRAVFGTANVDLMAYVTDGLLVLEIEPATAPMVVDPLELVQDMVKQVEGASSVAGLCTVIASEVQRVTGYDRVMVYRFEDDDSGHVVAEARSSDAIESFLDLHYPASDIPVQARQLYLSNWIRYIPNAEYSPIPVHPVLNPRSGLPLDLSFSTLRSVSPVHLEYLRNMGVRSSMSLSIVVGGKLWGLVACHHASPHAVHCRARAGLELFAQLASLQLQNRVLVDETAARLRSSEIRNKLVQHLSQPELSMGLLDREPDLLNLITADGVAIFADGKITTKGMCPTDLEIGALAAWLNETTDDGVYATDRLGEVWRGGTVSAPISGLLALSISRAPRDYIMWFLSDIVSSVTWAGHKDKPVTRSPDGDRLSPRTSFAAWTEIIKGRSRPWTDVERDAAGAFRVAILEVVLRRLDEVAREREQAQERQDLLLAELDHRVKNTLATIQSMVRFSGRSATDLKSFVRGVEHRLQAMAATHNVLTQSRWTGADLRTLIRNELAARDVPGAASVILRGETYLLDAKASLSLSMALHELVTNAVKHGCLSVGEGRLRVQWMEAIRDDETWLAIEWVESGGPVVVPPQRQGFGTLLLQRVFGQDVGGKAELNFAPGGLVCRLEIPMQRVTRPSGHLAVPGNVQVPAPLERSGVLASRRIMVVEDNPLVALELTDILELHGATVLGPFHRLSTAFQFAEGATIDAALLDVDIDGETSWELVRYLRDKGIPLVLTTGLAGKAARPDGFLNTILITKPYNEMGMIQTIRSVLPDGIARSAPADA